MSALLERVRTASRLPSPTVARAIRVGAGVSQAELAAELGVHRVTVARWEDGTRSPRGELRAKYVYLLDQLRKASAA
jgi:DNA-binding transcriptional regulator YiaG